MTATVTLFAETKQMVEDHNNRQNSRSFIASWRDKILDTDTHDNKRVMWYLRQQITQSATLRSEKQDIDPRELSETQHSRDLCMTAVFQDGTDARGESCSCMDLYDLENGQQLSVLRDAANGIICLELPIKKVDLYEKRAAYAHAFHQERRDKIRRRSSYFEASYS